MAHNVFKSAWATDLELPLILDNFFENVEQTLENVLSIYKYQRAIPPGNVNISDSNNIEQWPVFGEAEPV